MKSYALIGILFAVGNTALAGQNSGTTTPNGDNSSIGTLTAGSVVGPKGGPSIHSVASGGHNHLGAGGSTGFAKGQGSVTHGDNSTVGLASAHGFASGGASTFGHGTITSSAALLS